jgi:hypothetical protein
MSFMLSVTIKSHDTDPEYHYAECHDVDKMISQVWAFKLDQARGKHSSLLSTLIIYSYKKVYNIDTWTKKNNMMRGTIRAMMIGAA